MKIVITLTAVSVLAALVTYGVKGQLPPGNCETSSGICTAERHQSQFSSRDVSRMKRTFRREYNRNSALYSGSTSTSARSLGASDTSSSPNRALAGPTGSCRKTCWYWYPFSLYGDGWWLVVQYPGKWYQWFRYCWCANTTCSKFTTPITWRGRCQQEYTWVRFLVWRRNLGLRWRWFRLKSGCCCIPDNYVP